MELLAIPRFDGDDCPPRPLSILLSATPLTRTIFMKQRRQINRGTRNPSKSDRSMRTWRQMSPTCFPCIPLKKNKSVLPQSNGAPSGRICQMQTNACICLSTHTWSSCSAPSVENMWRSTFCCAQTDIVSALRVLRKSRRVPRYERKCAACVGVHGSTTTAFICALNSNCTSPCYA